MLLQVACRFQSSNACRSSDHLTVRLTRLAEDHFTQFVAQAFGSRRAVKAEGVSGAAAESTAGSMSAPLTGIERIRQREIVSVRQPGLVDDLATEQTGEERGQSRQRCCCSSDLASAHPVARGLIDARDFQTRSTFGQHKLVDRLLLYFIVDDKVKAILQ